MVILTSFISFIVFVSVMYHFKKESADGRLLVWKVTLNIIKENPSIGVGYDRFKKHYMDAQADYLVEMGTSEESMLADNSYYAFNEIIQLTAENGVLGLIIFAIMSITVINIRPLSNIFFFKIYVLGILLTAFVFGLFSYPSQILPIKMVVLYSLASLATIDSQKIIFSLYPQKKRITKSIKKIIKSALLVSIIVLAWCGFLYLSSIQKAFKDWQSAMYEYNHGLYKESLKGFVKAWPVLKNEGDYLMNYGKALTMDHQPIKALRILNLAKDNLNTTIIETAMGDAYKTLGHYIESEKAYQRAAEMVPSRFYPHYLLAKLYEESGQNLKAIKKAKEVLSKEIKIPSQAIREIKLEMKMILKDSQCNDH